MKFCSALFLQQKQFPVFFTQITHVQKKKKKKKKSRFEMKKQEYKYSLSNQFPAKKQNKNKHVFHTGFLWKPKKSPPRRKWTRDDLIGESR